MSTYANLHPASQVLMWAFDRTMGAPEERQEKTERLAQWIMTWRPSDPPKKAVYNPAESLEEFIRALDQVTRSRLSTLAETINSCDGKQKNAQAGHY